ncbi:MAG: YHS domain-containing protein [Armatimonadetes bacterium]|nr:YHS domain-containing protein [Armatimonadota bacterium]
MLNIIALTAVAVVQVQALKCPVTGSPVVEGSKVVEYAGSTYTFCCPGCDSQFVSSPEKFLTAQRKAGNITGTFLFDPVSRKRVELKDAKATTDYKGVRYPFESEADQAAFAKSPEKYASVPKKEALFCPVSKEVVSTYSKASDYADHDGVRFYFCCPGCMEPFLKDPEKYLAGPGKDPHAIKGKFGNPDAKLKLVLAKDYIREPKALPQESKEGGQ